MEPRLSSAATTFPCIISSCVICCKSLKYKIYENASLGRNVHPKEAAFAGTAAFPACDCHWRRAGNWPGNCFGADWSWGNRHHPRSSSPTTRCGGLGRCREFRGGGG